MKPACSSSVSRPAELQGGGTVSDVLAGSSADVPTGDSELRHAKVLVASPLTGLRHSLAAMLTEAGYWISVARTAAEVTEELTRGGIDILVVDADEAGESEILRTARKQTDLPIIALVGSAAGDAVVAAFDVGADDCAVWPDVSSDSGNVRELTRRHGALLKRARPRSPSATTEAVAGPGGLLMRPLAHEVSVSGVDLDLTPKEYGVLRLLLERRGEVLTTDAISQALWGYETFGARNFVEAHVSRLRHKLRLTGAPDLITTVQGVGYKVR